MECLTYGEAMDLCAIAIVHFAAELQQQPMTCCEDEILGSFIPLFDTLPCNLSTSALRTRLKNSLLHSLLVCHQLLIGSNQASKICGAPACWTPKGWGGVQD